MKFVDFLKKYQDKPFIDGRSFKLLVKNLGLLRNQLSGWEKDNKIIRLKRNFYIFADLYARKNSPEILANYLYTPSYLSLEYALSFYGLIPEACFAYTSITTKKTKDFSTPLGLFSYKSVKPQLFWGYYKNKETLIAEPEKALLDYIYLKLITGEATEDFFRHNLRLQPVNIFSISKFKKYCQRAGVPKLTLAAEILEKIWID